MTLLLFFASGFAGLVYQVLWMRELGFLFGNGSFATATTLAAFFLGIAAGGAVFGRRAGRSRRPLRTYAWLEAGVAVTALLYFGLLDLFHAVYAPLFERFGDEPALFVGVKFALALLILLPPAFFMGGTLPVMSQHLVRRADALGATASTLYAINTLGAALGAFATAFLLVRQIGVTGSYSLALATTTGVALLAGWLGRTPVPAGVAEAPPTHRGGAPLSASTVRLLAFLSGWTTLALEVLWTRMFAQVLQNSVYTFAVILVTFLVSLALGAAVAHVLARRSLPPRAVLLGLLLVSGLWVATTPLLFDRVTDGLTYFAAESGFADYVLGVFGAAALVLLIPTLLLGVVFPYLIKVAEVWGLGAGRTVGELAAVNTLGAVAGSLCAGFAMLVWLGMWQGLRLVAAIYLVAALLLALGSPRRRWLAALAPLAGLLVVATVLDADDLPLVSIDAEGRREKLVEVFEGTAATVAVIDRPDSRRIKLNNYYGLGGSGDRNQEARQAHLPLALHPAPRSVFFLGLGTGITAGASLQHPLERVVAAELVPEVVRASRSHFAVWINGLFDDPRARVVVEDGRNLLLASPDRFDVVVADLFLPWKAGSGSLYALELYQAGLARLAPGGIYGQWLSLIQVSHREFGTIARTLLEVFPRVTLWRGNYRKSHPLVLILGERDPAPLDSKAIQDRLSEIARNEYDAAIRGIGRSAAPETAQELLLYYQGNLSQARQLLDAYPINSDDHPFIEYNAPITHRNKRANEATAFRGTELLRFYDAIFEAAPPEADPVLAELSERERKLPRAGLELYRSQVLKHSGDSEGAASAYQLYRGLRDPQRPPGGAGRL